MDPTLPPGGEPGEPRPPERTLVSLEAERDALRDFRIEGRLGEGSMGVVYRARQLSLDRDVALKVLAPHLAANAGFVERFVREARTSVKLDHPNIVRGVAVGEERGLHYFAMEFVDGRSLDHYLGGDRALSVPDAVRVTADVAAALEHAHSRNILHRDVKPANIMVTRDGQVKLADLGLAKVMDEDSDLTRFGEGAGTPSYMAPEQARSARDVDHRSDVYALGATLYHLLTGRRPFAGGTAYEVIRAKESGRYEPPSRVNPSVPAVLDRIVERAMAVDPARRYQTAGEMFQALEATGLAGGPLDLAEPGGAPAGTGTGRGLRTATRPMAPAPPRRGWLLAGGGLAAAAVAGIAVWMLLLRGAPAPAPPAPGPAPAPAGPAAARPDREAADLVLARALGQIAAGQPGQARETLERGRAGQAGDPQIERPLAELSRGVLVLFQYQTPEETSPLMPLWRADGVTLTRRDNYRFGMVAGRECHVYAFQRDTRPSVTRIFPDPRFSSARNPLPPGVLHWLPDSPETPGRSWLHLDTAVGEERVFFVAVTRPLKDPQAVAQRLLHAAEGARQALAADLESFLAPGPGPGTSCFAHEGGPLQSFGFVHK